MNICGRMPSGFISFRALTSVTAVQLAVKPPPARLHAQHFPHRAFSLTAGMARKRVIYTDKAPSPLNGLYSQAIVVNDTVYCSGSVGMDPVTWKLVDGDISARTHQIMRNLKAVLEAAGTNMENVVKVNIFLTDVKDFAVVNEVYSQYFGDEKPCRTCVAVKQLPLDTDVEIECIAVLP